ncbi:hypothetical protein Tco_0125039, partial [Tanacetum coccineum]
VMVAPTIPVSTEENLGDPIDIRVDIIHPEPVAAVAFPAVAVVRTQSQHGEAIRGILKHLQRIKSIEAIETITSSQEKRTRMEIERQLASVQESQQQDQENLRKLQELVT